MDGIGREDLSIITTLKKLFWSAYVACYKTRDLCNLYKPVIDLNRDIGQTVLVLGSARSGTTWIGDVISSMLKARRIFEPFLLDKNRQFYLSTHKRLCEDNLDRRLQLYIRQHDEENVYAPQIEKILGGNIRSAWSNKGCNVGIYWRRVIKEVKANLFMAYIATNWPQVKIIWVIRNPLNVIESQMTMGQMNFFFDWNIHDVKNQPELLSDWLHPLMSEMTLAKSICVRLAHKWCIETYVPLKQGVEKLPNVLKVRYEDLTGNLKEWNRICNFLSPMSCDTTKLQKWLNTPSRTSRKFYLDGRRDIEKAISISEKESDEIRRIVDLYGLSSFLS